MHIHTDLASNPHAQRGRELAQQLMTAALEREEAPDIWFGTMKAVLEEILNAPLPQASALLAGVLDTLCSGVAAVAAVAVNPPDSEWEQRRRELIRHVVQTVEGLGRPPKLP